jgi:hypothetical protein
MALKEFVGYKYQSSFTFNFSNNFLYFLLFHGNKGYVNAPQCYVCTYIIRFILNFNKNGTDVILLLSRY